MLIAVFIGSLIKPVDNNWNQAFDGLTNGTGWTLDNSSIIKQLYSAGLEEQIVAAETPELKAELKEKKLLAGLTKIVLVLVFVGLSVLVYFASKKYKKGKE